MQSPFGDCGNDAGTKIFSRYVLVFFIGKFGVCIHPSSSNEIKKAKNVRNHWQVGARFYSDSACVEAHGRERS